MRRIVFLSSLCLFSVACSHLSQSDDDLRRQYLAITEPGISMAAAVDLIKSKIQPEGELLIRNNTPCREREAEQQQLGSASIKVNLGWYFWGVARTITYGEWCFNDADRLIDVIVYKSFDESLPTNP